METVCSGCGCVLLAAAGRHAAVGSRGRRWEQACAATNPDCRVPLEFRSDRALNHPEPPEKFPRGHLKPLGHPDFAHLWDGEIDVLDEMTPETFWTEYYPLKPFVLKGWGKNHPAMTKWKDDDYIIDNFGQHKVKIELKNEDRLTDYCGQIKFGERVICPQRLQPYVESYMNMSRFMKRYRAVDKFDHYVITQLFGFCPADAVARSGDDAADVRWVTLAEAEDGSIDLGGNVCTVLRRAEALLACGALELGDAVPPAQQEQP